MSKTKPISSIKSIAVLGECMLELSSVKGSTHSAKNMGFGGDTLNTSVYLSRAGKKVQFFTALGDDDYSNWMLSEWNLEGIATQYVRQIPGRVPGLYMIETDESGERRFHYWRDSAPARDLLNTTEKIAIPASRATVVSKIDTAMAVLVIDTSSPRYEP